MNAYYIFALICTFIVGIGCGHLISSGYVLMGILTMVFHIACALSYVEGELIEERKK